MLTCLSQLGKTIVIQDIDVYCNHGDDIIGDGQIEFTRIDATAIDIKAIRGYWDVTINGSILDGAPPYVISAQDPTLWLRYGFLTGFTLPFLQHWTGKQVLAPISD